MGEVVWIKRVRIGGGDRLGMNSKASVGKGAVPKVIGIEPFAKMEKCDSIGG